MMLEDESTPAVQEVSSPEPENVKAAIRHAPRKLTFVENLLLTAKVLAGFGLLGVALWGISFWTSAR